MAVDETACDGMGFEIVGLFRFAGVEDVAQGVDFLFLFHGALRSVQASKGERRYFPCDFYEVVASSAGFQLVGDAVQLKLNWVFAG